jgi:hypothetical protein
MAQMYRRYATLRVALAIRDKLACVIQTVARH